MNVKHGACKKVRWEFLPRAERSMVRAVCGVQPEDGKIVNHLMLVLGLTQTVDQLAVQAVFVGMVLS